ncbi:MAG: Uma2 family endonuclease [Sulfurovum sp.]
MDEALKLDDYSYEDYLDIDNSTESRVELIWGDIYMMAGASAVHQDIVGNIFFIFKTVTKEDKKCFPRVAPFDIKLIINNNISVVQPDVMLFCDKESLPCAVFEVLSPSTAYKDKTIKKDLYEQSGIREYFLVNSDFRTVDKFILKDDKYIYDRAYGEEDKLSIECFGLDIELADVFE